MLFETALGFTLASTSVAASGEPAGGERQRHVEVRAAYAISYRRPPAGCDIRFGTTAVLASVGTVDVQLASDTTQIGRRVMRTRPPFVGPQRPLVELRYGRRPCHPISRHTAAPPTASRRLFMPTGRSRMPSYFRPQPPRRAWLAACALAITAACSDGSPTDPGDDAAVAAATELRRLLVADATQPSARVIGLADNATLVTMTLDAPATNVYATESGRFGAVHQRAANVVSFVDGGVWLQGGGAQTTARRVAPRALGFQLTDRVPSYESVNGPWLTVFADGAGMVRLLDEREMATGTFRAVASVNTGGGHHGGAASLTTSAGTYLVHTMPNPAGGSPRTVAVTSRQGAEVARTDDCPGMHGQGATRSAAVLGCTLGAVLVRAGADGVPAISRLVPVGALEGLGVRSVWARHDADFLVGRLSTPAGAATPRRVLVTIDPATGAMQPLPIPENTVEHSLAVDPHTQRIVLLATTGTLYVIDGAARALRHTIAGVVPTLPASGALPHQVAVAEGMAYLASPTAGEVIVVNTTTGAVAGRIAVDGQPSRLAVLGVRADGQYRLASGG